VNLSAAPIETAAGADDRADPCFEIANPHFVADVAGLGDSPLVARGSYTDIPTGGNANGGIVENADEFLERSRGNEDRRIDIDKDFPARRRERGVLGHGFAAALRHTKQLDAPVREAPHYVIGSVC
jgi:hypothetical protein